MFGGSIGIPEILLTLTAVLILFGGRKIPQLARDLGSGIREFKRSLTNARDDLQIEEEARHQLIEGEHSIARGPLRKGARKAKKKAKRRT